jgi:hypothetical protein
VTVEPMPPVGGAPDHRATPPADAGPAPAAGTVVSISIEGTEPLAGTATCARLAPVPFSGWLELLRAVSQLVADARRDAPDGVGRGGCPRDAR